MKRSNRYVLVFLISIFVTVNVPLSIYRNNADELNFTFFDIIPVIALAFFLALLMVGGLVTWITQRWPVWGVACFSALFYALCIQADIFRWNYGQLETGSWYFQWRYGLIDGVSWILIFFLAIRHRTQLVPFFAELNRVYVLVVLSMLAITLWWIPYQKMAYTLDDQPRFEFSTQKNVILIVYDEAQSNIFLDLISREQEFKNVFSGFTFFRNSLSNTKSTSLSLPMILTGNYYDNSMVYSRYVKKNLQTGSLPSQLKSLGYRVDFHPGRGFFTDDYIDDSFISNLRPRAFNLAYAAQLYDLTLFAVLPHFAKRLIYDDHSWWLQSKKRAIASINRRIWKWTGTQALSPQFLVNDEVFFRRAESEVKKQSKQPRFKFYHLDGAHSPFNIDALGNPVRYGTYRDKLIYKTRKLAAFFQQLKEQGIYDRSLIVIAGDHGSGREESTRIFHDPHTGQFSRLGVSLSRANALLMVKDFAATSFSVNDHPVQSLDIREMVMQLLEGKSLDSQNFSNFLPQAGTGQRARLFFTYPWNAYQPYAKEYAEYIVLGPTWRRDSYLEYHNHAPGFDPQRCFFKSGREVRSLGVAITSTGLRVKIPADALEILLIAELEEKVSQTEQITIEVNGQKKLGSSAEGRANLNFHFEAKPWAGQSVTINTPGEIVRLHPFAAFEPLK